MMHSIAMSSPGTWNYDHCWTIFANDAISIGPRPITAAIIAMHQCICHWSWSCQKWFAAANLLMEYWWSVDGCCIEFKDFSRMNNPSTTGQCIMSLPFHIYEKIQDDISLSLAAAIAAVAATNPAAIPRLVAAGHHLWQWWYLAQHQKVASIKAWWFRLDGNRVQCNIDKWWQWLPKQPRNTCIFQKQ